MSIPLSPHPETSLDPENTLTPGELLLQLQVSVLKKERFASVLGAHTVDSIGLDWDRIGHPDTAVDDLQKIVAMRRLSTALNDRLICEPSANPDFTSLYLDVSKLRVFSSLIHSKRLEAVTTDFFQRLFPNSTLNIGEKHSGVQMGLKATVTLKNGETRRYE